VSGEAFEFTLEDRLRQNESALLYGRCKPPRTGKAIRDGSQFEIWLPLVDALRTVLVVPTSDLRAMLDQCRAHDIDQPLGHLM
jgi:hypothetical protein